MSEKSISVIIPILNERENINPLITKIHTALNGRYEYEIIFIDDHSTDGTIDEIKTFTSSHPISYESKKGKRGKAYSLLQGFKIAKHDLIAMIDADLQYPPEALPAMLEKIEAGHDVVVAGRSKHNTNINRQLTSRFFNYIFGRLMHNFSVDVQAGFKVFRKEIIERIKINPSPWTFDLEFLIEARNAGYKITSHEIVFHKRTYGESKVNLFATSFQIGLSAIWLKLKPHSITPFHKAKLQRSGQGFHYKSIEYTHFSDLPSNQSAFVTLVSHQKLFIFALLALIAFGLYLSWIPTLIFLIGFITVVYFIDLFFNLYLIIRSFTMSPEIQIEEAELNKIKDWPMYTVLCPLYKEWQVVAQFVEAMEKLDYPKDKLQVQLLLEEDDIDTINHVRGYNLPPYYEIIVVPHSLPKTKPKACNYGLRFAKGEYVVIYDAEDSPDPLQLKKAVAAFRKSDPLIACIQAKLNYFNSNQNLLTRLFTAEYSLWFDLILPGLQSINSPIPLGGTSNHFKIEKLKEVKGWDSFNVTEDCDLGIRLTKHGYSTAIIESVTLEEANSEIFNWINQRSRWIKGYMQSYLVHMRYPQDFLKGRNKLDFFTFQLVVGGKILSLFINPLMWVTTILYFGSRTSLGPIIERFFPGEILYMGAFCLIFGNFLYLFYYMVGCAKRKQYTLIKFAFFIPFYWLVMSIAAWKGLIQLIFNPHYWAKTKHGLNVKHKEDDKKVEIKLVAMETPISKAVERPRAFSLPRFGFLGNLSSFKYLFVSGGGLIIAGVITNLLNYLYTGYLSRVLTLEDFGMISLISTLLFVTIIPLDALSSSVSYKSAYFLGKYQTAISKFWYFTRQKASLYGLIAMVIWLIAIPWTSKFFQADSIVPLLLFAPVWLFSTVFSVDSGFIVGNHMFYPRALLTVFEALFKLSVAYILVTSGNTHYVYAAIPASIIVTSLFAYFIANTVQQQKQITDDKSYKKFPRKYFVSALLTKFALISYLTLDVFIAKHFLSPAEAGQYALVAITGKTIFFIGGLFNQFIVPVVSKELGENNTKKNGFLSILITSTFSSLIFYIGIGLFGYITGPILFGEKIQPVTYLLPIYGIGILCFSVASAIVTFHQIKQTYIFSVTSFILALLQIAVSFYFHGTLDAIVFVMTIFGAINLGLVLVLYYFENTAVALTKNLLDFVSLILPIPEKKTKLNKLRVLIFNWRDTKHVWSGGAEIYIHEIGKKLVAKGHSVTVFSGNDNQSKRYEEIDGIQVIRRGGFYTVYIWAYFYYILRFRNKFDLIIDSENGIPFFTPIYVRKPIIGLVHHVHQEVFRANLSPLLARFACFLEGSVMPFVYKNITMITVSDSTRDAMRIIGFGNTQQISIVHPGIEHDKFKLSKKTSYPSLLYLGRLKPYKSVHIAIEAMARILKELPSARFTIAGFGESLNDLKDLTKKLNIEHAVKFLGKVTDETKVKLLAESWVFVYPSAIEGWGISAIEANAAGTPVVASNVPGLRDSVQNPHTGFLATYGDVTEFTTKILLLLNDEKLRSKFSQNSVEWSKNFSWDKSTEKLLKVIENEL